MSRALLRAGLAATMAASSLAIAAAAASPSAFGSTEYPGGQLTSLSYDGVHFPDGSVIPAYSNAPGLSWSPDGSQFAYVGSGSGIYSIRYDDPDGESTSAGGSAITLVEPGDGDVRSNPTWSADGTLIYFQSKIDANLSTISVSLTAGGWGQVPVTPDDGYDYFTPDAGPNGLVAMRQLDDGLGDPTGTPQVVSIDPVNHTVTPIVDDARDPAIAPDGQHVAFIRSDGTYDQVYTTDIAGGNLRQITADAENHAYPVWWGGGYEISVQGTSPVSDVETASPLGTDKDAPLVASLQGTSRLGSPTPTTRSRRWRGTPGSPRRRRSRSHTGRPPTTRRTLARMHSRSCCRGQTPTPTRSAGALSRRTSRVRS